MHTQVKKKRFKNLRKLVNFKKVPAMLVFDGDHPATTPLSNFHAPPLKTANISCKTLHIKTNLA